MFLTTEAVVAEFVVIPLNSCQKTLHYCEGFFVVTRAEQPFFPNIGI